MKEKKEIALSVKNVSISYKIIKKFSVKKNLLKLKKVESERFKAVNNVSFEVEKGKIVGIIGANGAGKSTLLRAIAGVFSPDKGNIDLHGSTASLLSIGVGFQKKLTGIENIFLSGMLLGFSKKEIEDKLENIIAFADLGNFIKKPVNTYSSGMYSKLAFAITSTLETDIILIDEVLSVGDAQFKKKSYNKMKELISCEDKTVLIVSHNLQTIKELCDEVLWLDKGKLKMQGEVQPIVEEYILYMDNLKQKKGN